MTTPAPADTSAVLADLDTALDAEQLVEEIERYLTVQPMTAHPLVSLPTAELVRQALSVCGPGGQALPVSSPLRGIWRVLPDRLLILRRPRGPVDHRPLTVAQHLELTAAVLEHTGWAHTGPRVRTRLGHRCILGAQIALYAMGYGDAHAAQTASTHLNHALRARGIRTDYPAWNESATHDQVIQLIREATATAR